MKTLILLFCGLIAFTAEALSPEERKKLFDESIQTLKGTGIEKNAPQLGGTFPDSEIAGKKVTEYVKEGPLLVVVYRGGWCPYCVKQLKDLQANINRLKDFKVTVIGISPEKETEVRKTKKKNDLSFTLVSDEDGKLLRELGLMFKVDDKVAQEYKNLGINLAESQGNSRQELPVPATYLVGKNRKVIYGYIDADYRKRPGTEELFSTLKEMR